MAGALVTTNILATAVAMGLATLRENLALVHIANRDYENEITAAKRFGTINVAVPAAVSTRNVVPDVVPPAVTAVTPTSVPITLTEWREAAFAMDDKGIAQVDRGIIPMQLQEAAKSLATYVEDFLWTKTAGISAWAGTPGVTPFATDLSAYLAARKLANKNLMPMDNRWMVINEDAEANALGLRAFQDASFRGDTDGIINGQIGKKLGATWLMSNHVPRHTSGTYTTGTTVTGVEPIGETVLALSGGATGTLIAGDIIGIGDYTYSVVSSVGAGTPSSVTIAAPGLVVATAGSEAIVKKSSIATSYAQNLLIHRDAIAFAMAPLMDTVVVPGATLTSVAIDEISGLSLRLEVSRQHRQVQWAFDALFGATLVRPNQGVWLAGE
jgi:hypothetical protein